VREADALRLRCLIKLIKKVRPAGRKPDGSSHRCFRDQTALTKVRSASRASPSRTIQTERLRYSNEYRWIRVYCNNKSEVLQPIPIIHSGTVGRPPHASRP